MPSRNCNFCMKPTEIISMTNIFFDSCVYYVDEEENLETTKNIKINDVECKYILAGQVLEINRVGWSIILFLIQIFKNFYGII